MMSQSSAPPEALATSCIQLPFPNGDSPNSGSPSYSTAHPTPAMSLVAARKAALLQKFGVKEIVQTPELTSTSSSSPNIEWSWKNRIRELETLRSSPYSRERRDTMDSFPLAKTLTATPTGSTLASTVVDNGFDEVPPLRSSQSIASVGNRVKMAIAAFSQLERSTEGKTVIKVSDEYCAAGQRSWSRLSGATRVHDEWNSPPRKSGLSDSSPVIGINSLSVEDPFDTHPPDMKSPRTMLAHVLEPPKRLPALFSQERSVAEASPSITTEQRPVSPHIPESKVSDAGSKVVTSVTSIEEEPVCDQLSQSPLPCPSIQGEGPKWIQGKGIRTDRHRALSLSTSVRPSVHARKSHRGPTSSISIQRPRLSSTISRSVSYSHSTPLTIKAQNPIPLRKIAKPSAPKPFCIPANI